VKVLFVTPLGMLGGAERSLLDMLAALRLVAPNIELSVLTFAPGPLLERARHYVPNVSMLELPPELAELGEGASFRERFPHRATSVLRFLRRLSRRIEEEAPDVVHTNGIKAHVLCSAACLRPTVLHFRDFMRERKTSRLALGPIVAVGRRLGVANSNAVARDVEACFPRLRVRAVPNAIDLEDFSPGSVCPEILSQWAGMPPALPGTISYGLAATYARWKGHDLYLRAAALFRQRRPDVPVRFYVIGSPIYSTVGSQYSEEEVRDLVERLGLSGHVGLVPFQAAMAPVYRALDIVVHASTRPEPFGRTVAEAMACGRPVIVAEEGGARELFTPGVSAIGCRPRSVLGLADAMEALGTAPELAAELGRRARMEAEVKFDRRRLGADLVRIYEELLQEP
jgi:glycosyltransferase involved in cell wall biosynthesis